VPAALQDSARRRRRRARLPSHRRGPDRRRTRARQPRARAAQRRRDLPAMLAAIRGAKQTITFANFVYEKGEIARDMAHALAERALAGVGVSVLIDAVGSKGMPSKYRALMEKAGCHVASYHSLNPISIKRINHRNHRRVLVVDGRVGFTGGTGIGEKWTGDGRAKGHWRQTDVRVEGPIVRFLQAAFAENWRDAT